MSRERIVKALANLGFTETDSEIYILLAEEGPQKGRNIREVLNLCKHRLYKSLKRLQEKGVVSSTLERPALFSAVPLETVLEVLIEAKKKQALALQNSKKELLSTWYSTVNRNSANS